MYDRDLDFVVLPTSYISDDSERAVLHEMGHALTLTRATARPALLVGLPVQIERHIRQYRDGEGSVTLELQVQEVLAEAFAWLVAGKGDRLPPALLEEILFILHTVTEDESQVRFDLDAP